MDIGAYHPFRFSNTAHFYLSGWRGINIDANPNTIELFKRYRPRDRNLWSAVISKAQVSQGVTEVKLQIPDQGQAHGVSARGFVENAEQLAGHFDPPIQTIPVPATSIDAILNAEDVADIDLLNIDVEGLDATILDEFDFTRCRPRLIIIEDFALGFEDVMRSRATVLLNAEGYRLFARVGWSSIFVLD